MFTLNLLSSHKKNNMNFVAVYEYKAFQEYIRIPVNSSIYYLSKLVSICPPNCVVLVSPRSVPTRLSHVTLAKSISTPRSRSDVSIPLLCPIGEDSNLFRSRGDVSNL